MRLALGILLGVGITTAGLVMLAGSQNPGVLPAGRMADCGGTALWLFAPGDDLASRAIDAATGSGGWSHVLIETCELGTGGEALAIDCQIAEGVHRTPMSTALERYQGRQWARVVITGGAGREFYGCVRARVGTKFDALDAIAEAGHHDRTGITCAALVAACLPLELARRVESVPARGPLATSNPDLVTPNRIAEAFGAEPGGSVTL